MSGYVEKDEEELLEPKVEESLTSCIRDTETESMMPWLFSPVPWAHSIPRTETVQEFERESGPFSHGRRPLALIMGGVPPLLLRPLRPFLPHSSRSSRLGGWKLQPAHLASVASLAIYLIIAVVADSNNETTDKPMNSPSPSNTQAPYFPEISTVSKTITLITHSNNTSENEFCHWTSCGIEFGVITYSSDCPGPEYKRRGRARTTSSRYTDWNKLVTVQCGYYQFGKSLDCEEKFAPAFTRNTDLGGTCFGEGWQHTFCCVPQSELKCPWANPIINHFEIDGDVVKRAVLPQFAKDINMRVVGRPIVTPRYPDPSRYAEETIPMEFRMPVFEGRIGPEIDSFESTATLLTYTDDTSPPEECIWVTPGVDVLCVDGRSYQGDFDTQCRLAGPGFLFRGHADDVDDTKKIKRGEVVAPNQLRPTVNCVGSNSTRKCPLPFARAMQRNTDFGFPCFLGDKDFCCRPLRDVQQFPYINHFIINSTSETVKRRMLPEWAQAMNFNLTGSKIVRPRNEDRSVWFDSMDKEFLVTLEEIENIKEE